MARKNTRQNKTDEGLDKGIPEITQDTPIEIEQPDIVEFDPATEHPKEEDNRIQSEKMRYDNADSIYE